MKEEKGACRFCGQIVLVKVPESATEEEIIEEASLNCRCKESFTYQIEKMFTSKAAAFIDELIKDDEIKLLMNQAAVQIAKFTISNATYTRGGWKYSISRGKNGPKVNKTYTTKETME